MSGWTANRFWDKTEVVKVNGGFTVHLDGRPVRTPAKAALIVPTRDLAAMVAGEWDAQDGRIDPERMPATRTANAAIDKVSVQHSEIADTLAAYGDSDLLCYRAGAPRALVDRQSEAWDPLLDWASESFGARLRPVVGVMHTAQDPAVLQRLSRHIHALNAFELAAFHDLVTLPGSLIIGFAASRQAFDIEDLWNRARVDEIWQHEQWGRDDEAAKLAEHKKQAFETAAHIFRLSR